jgi:hypothetical protein
MKMRGVNPAEHLRDAPRRKGWSMSTKNILAGLAESNQLVTLGIELAGEIIPLGKALISDIRKISIGGKTYTYEELLAADNAELDVIHSLVGGDLEAVNAELAAMGLPPLRPAAPKTP